MPSGIARPTMTVMLSVPPSSSASCNNCALSGFVDIMVDSGESCVGLALVEGSVWDVRSRTCRAPPQVGPQSRATPPKPDFQRYIRHLRCHVFNRETRPRDMHGGSNRGLRPDDALIGEGHHA